MRTPNVKNVNLGKRHKKKHYFKVGDSVVFKWWGNRDYGYISELTFEKTTKIAQYSIKSIGHVGCIYHTLELDDPNDTYCYVSSVLTKSISASELNRINEHINKTQSIIETPTKTVVKRKSSKTKRASKSTTKQTRESVNKSELKIAISKQTDFLNGNIDKSFW